MRDPVILKIVEPTEASPKSGCLRCPLAPLADDFDLLKELYENDSDKIIDAQKFPHRILHRCVSEPWSVVDILFVGEALMATENEKGKPFVGKAGQLLRNTLNEIFKDEKIKPRIGFTNMARCQPPGNKLTPQVVRCCSPELLKEVAVRKPKVIVPLGNVPFVYMTGCTGITQAAGKLYQPLSIPEWTGIKIAPCLHPAYILRNDSAFDQFADALSFAVDAWAGRTAAKKGDGNYVTLNDPQAVVDLVQSMLVAGKKVALDTETGSLTPFQCKFPTLLCVSLTNVEGKGWVIPWDHRDSPWAKPEPDYASLIPDITNEPARPKKAKDQCKAPGIKKWNVWEEWQARNMAYKNSKIPAMKSAWQGKREFRMRARMMVRKAVIDLITSRIPKVLQNEKFDRKHLRHEFKAHIFRPVYDTMLRHATIDETLGTHGLDKLAAAYTGMAGYDQPLSKYIKEHVESSPDKGGSYANIPGELLFRYAAQDADVTLRVENALIKEPEYAGNKKFQIMAEIFMPALSVTIADMEYQGAFVNLDVAQALTKEYEAKEKVALEKLRALPRVRQFEADRIASGKHGEDFHFNPNAPQQVAKILFEYYKRRPIELTKAGMDVLKHRHAYALRSNPAAQFSDFVEKAIRTKEWGFFSTSSDVLQMYEHEGNDFVPLLSDYKSISKTLGTYFRPIVHQRGPDGIVRGNFNILGAATGRLASNGPNLQNQPDEARAMYVSRFENGVILQADYSQIELRVASCIFDDPSMRKVYLENGDIHAETSIIISNLTPEQYKQLPDGKKKELRKVAKRVNFGSIYCIGPAGIQRTLRKEGVFITTKEAEAFLAAFFAKRPRLQAGMKRQEDYCRKHGYVMLFTGRRRRLPEIHADDQSISNRAARQAVNAPVQGTAGEMLLISMVLIHRELLKRKLRTKLMITVHDSLVLDCPKEEVLEVATFTKEIMEGVHKKSEAVWPGLDWSWLTVPIVAELECGLNWSAGIKFNPATLVKGGTSSEKLHWLSDKKEFMHRDPVNFAELEVLMQKKAA